MSKIEKYAVIPEDTKGNQFGADFIHTIAEARRVAKNLYADGCYQMVRVYRTIERDGYPQADQALDAVYTLGEYA